MKISRDAWILIVLLSVFVFAAYNTAQRSVGSEDTPSTYSVKPKGTKALFLLLQEDKRLHVERYSGKLSNIPANADVVLVPDSRVLSDSNARSLAKWARKGNTLILAAPTLDIPELDLADEYSPNHHKETVVAPEPGEYAKGVKQVRIDAESSLAVEPDTEVLIRDKAGAVAVEHRLGRGRVIAMTDPLVMSNSMIRKCDNVVFITNLVYRNVTDGGSVLFAEYHPDTSAVEKNPRVLGLGGKLALSMLAFVVLVVLISAGIRFGATHPLVEKTDKRRAWELVSAMAGLYRHAEARGTALTSISHSFMRELVTRYGVSSSAPPSDVAETILRARNVDRARLTSLLQRCRDIENGQPTSDAEVLKLVKSIEEFRRELGIARSTND